MSYKPSIGDTGTFYPHGYLIDGGFGMAKPPAVRGKITRVWTDTCVNIECENGVLPTSVLVVDPEKKPESLNGYYFVPDALVHEVSIAKTQELPAGAVVKIDGLPFEHLGGGLFAGDWPLAKTLATETKVYSDGTSATGPAPLPEQSPAIGLLPNEDGPVFGQEGRMSYTFDEFVEHGRKQKRGLALVNDMPWSFDFHGFPVTHENDNLYIIADGSVGGLKFGRGNNLLVLNLETGKLRVDQSVVAEPAGPLVWDSEQDGPATLADDFAAVINRHSAENPSGTPDYILGQYLADCLDAWNKAIDARVKYFGKPSPLAPRARAG